MAISGIAWRLTAGQEASSCGAVFGLGRSLDDAAEANRRFVPRLPPSYGRPHHPYAGKSLENITERHIIIIFSAAVKRADSVFSSYYVSLIGLISSSHSHDVSRVRVQSSAAVLPGVHARVPTEAVAVGQADEHAARHGIAATDVQVATRHADKVSPDRIIN